MIAVLMLLSANAAVPYRNDFQLMISPTFDRFAAMTDTACPTRRLRYLTPGDLDGLEEGFEQQLSIRLRRAIAERDRGVDGCENKEGGLSCPAQNRLDATRQAHLLNAFAHYACASSI